MSIRFPLSCLVLSFLLSCHARASYIIVIQQIGPDVVASGSGSIDTTDLTSPSSASIASLINGGEAQTNLGPITNTNATHYTGLTGTTSFGNININRAANSGSGPIVGIQGNAHALFVPAGYTSGSPLAGSSDNWSNQSFSTLGLIPGTYPYTWGTGPDADSLTVQIVPEPASLSLLAVGGLVMMRRARRRG